MGHLNVFLVVITLLVLMSMHANEAGRILHEGEQELIKKNSINQRAFMGYNVASLQGSLPRGPVPPSGPNPPTHHPASTIGQKAFGGHSMAPFKSSLPRGPVPPSGPNPPTHNPASSTSNSGTHNIPVSTINQKAFGGHNMAPFKTSLAKGTVPRSEPNPPTYIPSPRN